MCTVKVLAALTPAEALLDSRSIRWTLCATDRCFKHAALVPFFRAAKVRLWREHPIPLENNLGPNQAKRLWHWLISMSLPLEISCRNRCCLWNAGLACRSLACALQRLGSAQAIGCTYSQRVHGHVMEI